MSFSPNLFLSNIKAKDGLAKPSRFEVILPIPAYVGKYVGTSLLQSILNFPNSIFTDVSDAISVAVGGEGNSSTSSNPSISRYLALQCETAELPGKALNTQDVKIYGPTFKVPFQTVFQDISLTFLCTNDFYERKLFERWIESIHPSDTYNFRYPKDQSTGYMANIKIIQYDEFIKQIFAVELVDAFPTSIAAQPLSWSEEGFHRLTITFAYQKYKPVYDGGYDLSAAAAALFGTAGSRLLPLGNALTL
tara:strand:- start:99 stop:845 length:747 start_codon:yes stop_codon:yes gene_type:complete